jgi:hypothetical protein
MATKRNVVFGPATQIDARFNPDDRRAQAFASVLEDLRRQKLPAYLELDDSGFVARIRVPELVRVEKITETPAGGATVTFERAHARYIVKSEDADVLAALRAAGKDQWLAVAVTDDFMILDVFPYEPPFDFEFPRPRPPIRAWWLWWWWPWNWFWWWHCVSKTRAQQLFDICAAPNCNPGTAPSPCIPFMFPDNGCWARAHEMCRLIIAAGAHPDKVWIQGTLHTPTKNHPNCFVNWGWHVAPTLCVRKYGWWWPWSSETYVVDPALFTTPVPEATWKGVQGDPNATLTHTSADDYYWGSTDPSYTQTNIDLQTYRTALKNRSANIGPPPYANCP